MAASFRNEDGTWNDSSVSFNSDSSSESSLHSPPLKKHKRNTNTKSKTILSTNTNTNNTVNTVNTAAQSPWAFATRNERSVKLTRAARSKIPPKQKKKKRKQIKTKKKSKKKSKPNKDQAARAFMANLMRWKLNVNRGRLFFCDGVAYNRTSFTGVMCLCPFMHMIICPLHCGCNSQAEVMESDEGGKILARVYREGTKLFKNSRARVKAWKNYRLSKEQAIDDPKVQGLLESVTDEEFKSLYGESRNDVESRIDDQVERKDNEARIDDEDTNLTNTELSNRSVEALVNVNGEPIKYIKNKWKIHIFLAYYWSIVFLDMISWCHSYFHREWYFTQLSDETVVMISCLLLFWWYLLRPWIQVILTFEKRKPAHHKAYNLITGYFTHVKNAKIDLDADDEDEIDWTLKHNQILKNKPAKVQKMCVKMCNKMVATYHKALLKRYDLNKDPMKYWSCCRFLDPEYKSDCLDIFEAFKHIKFGPAMYENNPNKIDSFRKGFVHFRTVICKLDVDISHGAYLGIDFEFVRKNQTMTGELALARYKMEGDIVTLFETLNELLLTIHLEILPSSVWITQMRILILRDVYPRSVGSLEIN
eukprot:1158989_1